MKRKICAFLILFHVLVCADISSAFETSTCGRNYVPFLGGPAAQKNFELIELIKREIVPSPFFSACQNGTRKSEIPGLMARTLPERNGQGDGQGKHAQDFFRLIAEKVKLYLARNQQQSEKLMKCIDGNNLKCEEESIKKIQTTASAARGHLALVQALESLNLAAATGQPNFTKGSSAAPNGLSKGTQWDQYSDAEFEEAKLVAKRYQEEAIAEAKKNQKISQSKTPPEKEVRKIIEVLAAHHLYEYRKLMINNISLQFIPNEKPKFSQINNALAQLESNRSLEEAEMNEVIRKIDQNPNEFDRDHLWLLDYKFLVEETLMEHPQFCSLATSLDKLSSNSDTHKVLAVFALAAVVPPVLAIASVGATIGAATAVNMAIGGATSYVYLSDSYSKLKKAEQAARVGPSAESAVKSQKEVDSANTDLKVGVAASPLLFMKMSTKQMLGLAVGTKAAMFLGMSLDQLNQSTPSTVKASGAVFKKVGESGVVTRAKPDGL